MSISATNTDTTDPNSTGTNAASTDERRVSPNFITDIIERDLQAGRVDEVVTRFPPEPNGFAHIGHAWASLISYGLAEDYSGRFHLRIDDTNPETEKQVYADAQIRDLAWLGLNWADRLFYASDYFERLYDLAVQLIKEGKAYVDSSSEEEIALARGTVTEAGRESPYRERSVAENLELFQKMREGAFPEGSHVLRAHIDMASPNMKLRDPILYRIMHTPHYRTGDTWHVYPMYDFAHPLSDAIEGITHSLCDVGFTENRAVYDWLTEALFGTPRPHQYEFGRRSLEYTVTSKRLLAPLVAGAHVSGWDDPRLPTIAGLRRRGVTPEALQDFAARVGISKTNRTVDIALLEFAIRDSLNQTAPRVMAVLDPLKVTLTNYSGSEKIEAPYWPPDFTRQETRSVPFTDTLYIEREDFSQTPPKGFKRLSPGEHVRLRHAYVIRCDEVVKNAQGEVSELRCSYLPQSLGASTSAKVKGAIHWVAAEHALSAEVRLYDRLFAVPDPAEREGELSDYLNPSSLAVKRGFVEPSIAADPADTRYQFERLGYFWRDPEDSSEDALVFNRIVTLKDSWERKDEAARPQSAATPKNVPEDVPGEAPDPVLRFSAEQRTRLEHFTTLGVAHDDAVLIAQDAGLSAFFSDAAAHADPQALANWTVNEVRRELSGAEPSTLPFSAADLAALVTLIDEDTISGRTAKEVFAEMLASGKAPADIVAERRLEQVTDADALSAVVDTLLAENPDKVAAYRGGKKGLLGFFVGQAMRETGGRANPQLVQSLVKERLETDDETASSSNG